MYGLQWGDPHEAERFAPVLDLIAKYAHGSVMEVGSGGGRWTRDLVTNADTLLAVDGTPDSERLIRASGIDCTRIQFDVCADGELRHRNVFDCVFSFDTFVHFHPQLFLNYLASVRDALLPGGVFILHYARFFPGVSDYNAQAFKYWSRLDVIEASGLEFLDVAIPFPHGCGSELLVLRK